MLLFAQNLGGAYVVDSGAATDSANISVLITVADFGAGLEGTIPAINYLVVGDTSTGTDSLSIESLVLVEDTSNSVEVVEPSIYASITDASNSSDSLLVSPLLSLAESSFSSDSFNLYVNPIVADLSVGSDTLSLDIYTSVSDASHSTDLGVPQLSKIIADYGYSLDDVILIKAGFSYITKEGNKLNPDTYLELFDFDASMLFDRNGQAGQVSYYTNTPTGGGITPITWRGNSYYPMPFEVTGVESRGDGTAPARPQITISNVNQFLLAAVLSLGDLVGMKVTRWRTFYKFTDNGSQPNTLMCYPVDTWIVTRKIAHTKNGIQFEMSSPLDRPGLRLPRQQILRDQGFPGVSRLRVR